jgi:extracellular factor (EF) 3-hydroxypalmitic acid methyl ester biosynthesis protein
VQKHLSYIQELVQNGGPEPSEYRLFNSWLRVINNEMMSGTIGQDDMKSIRDTFGKAISLDTMQGFSFHKPHGYPYPGDYEIIDKIYQDYHASDPSLVKWDQYFQTRSAPIAVRNRKDYFNQLLKNLEHEEISGAGSIKVLNIASGPARDMFEFFNNSSNGKLQFDCIEFDQNAINYAASLCSKYLAQINFINASAFKFRTKDRYRFIWAAGIFDYFDDDTFVRLLQRYLCFLAENGEFVIGNFSPNNPTKNYMEIVGDWHLNHRSADKLITLTRACGVDQKNIRIGQEPEGVNLFLHIKPGGEFVYESA